MPGPPLLAVVAWTVFRIIVKVAALVLVCNPSPPSLDVLIWHRWFRDISEIDNVALSHFVAKFRRKFQTAWKIPDAVI